MADSNQDLGNKLAQNDKNNQGKWMQESTDSWDTSWSEKDLDGNLIDVNENANTLETIVNIQESIFIQTEQVEKVDDKRQQAEAKAKDDIVSTVSTNGKAIADLKLRAGGWNQKRLRSFWNKGKPNDNSALLDRLNIVQNSKDSTLCRHLEEVKSLNVEF